jgi:hypothetical protein
MTQPKSPKPLQAVSEKLARKELFGFRQATLAAGKAGARRSVAKLGLGKLGLIKPPVT